MPSPPRRAPLDHDFEMDEELSQDEASFTVPTNFTRARLSDLVRDIKLPKIGHEILASELSFCCLTDSSVLVHQAKTRDAPFKKYFKTADRIVYCCDIMGLIELFMDYNPNEWRLFLDASCSSFKACLIHNGNEFPTIPVAYTTIFKESRFSVEKIFEKLQYEKHNWLICGDFKMLNFVLGLQQGYTSHPCFLCLWDSRADDEHYRRKEWPRRTEWVPSKQNIQHKKLADLENILLPPLHIKLGLMKQFISTLVSQNQGVFEFLCDFFAKDLSVDKIKAAGSFTGPLIRRLIEHEPFNHYLEPIQLNAWKAFQDVISSFFGNIKSPDFERKVANLIQAFEKMGCRMSIKMHFLDSHLDWFPDNLGDFSEEQGEKFHQTLKFFERNYSSTWQESMMSDYMWFTLKECDEPRPRTVRRKHFVLRK